MKVNKIESLEVYQTGFEIEAIGNQAINQAISKNKELGIPTVFSVNGIILYELPNGEITTDAPFELEQPL